MPATLATPLTDLLKGGGKEKKPVQLGPATLEAFQALKRALCRHPVLHTPLPRQPFIRYTNASNVGLVAVLSQQTPQGE